MAQDTDLFKARIAPLYIGELKMIIKNANIHTMEETITDQDEYHFSVGRFGDVALKYGCQCNWLCGQTKSFASAG